MPRLANPARLPRRGARDAAAGRARAGYGTVARVQAPVRGDANEVGTATATADAADHARGRRWMAPNQCRAASAYNVPPQPAIARPGGGRHRTALDRGRR